MPPTNQTDHAGREWRTTASERERLRFEYHSGTYIGDILAAPLDDLETALAKIEALEAELRETAGAYLDAHAQATENKYRAEAAEARVTALEGALHRFVETMNIAGRVPLNLKDVYFEAAALLNPDPAEQPEAGR